MKRLKIVVSFLAAIVFAGCTSLKPIEMAPSQLHTEIRENSIVEIGERIKVVTIDGSRHEFKVREITDTSIIGDSASVEIKDIVALETRKFSGGKTALLVGGMYTVFALLAIAAASVTVGL